MQRPNRKTAIALVRFYAKTGDMASATRVYIESGMSYATFRKAIGGK